MTEQEKRRSYRNILIILVLTISVIISSAFIGTLAKYATSNAVSDSAIVAKFGLEIPNTINLFSDSYTGVEADTADKKIIAPGTQGQYAFVVTGVSEVAYKVSADITVTYSDEWGGYEPLEFSVNGNDWLTLAAFQTKLSGDLASNILQPNERYENEQTIYWRWPFHTSDANDIKDTAMGAAATTAQAPTVTVMIEATAAQVA